ncbi:MAG TPA: Calx-beta domain-containing protein [Candidatus Limnocylindrales bacterium]|nr:Calx-beta domain-containing protein [Candidatus Limnocylindrales bacterium]
MRMGLRCAAVLAATIAVSSTTLGEVTGPALAGPCVRTVGIAQQVSAAEGAGRLTFTVFTGGCAAVGDVGYTVTGGTAQAGTDFKPQSGHLHWESGDILDTTITVLITQDSLREADLEDFTVHLIDPGPGVQIIRSVGQGRVLDDDGPTIAWSVDDSTCTIDTPDPSCFCRDVTQLMPIEPNCDVIDFDLSAGLPSPARMWWSTLDGSARAGIDYVPVTDRPETIPAGAVAGELVVRLLPRPSGTPRRWFYVRLSGVSEGVVIDGIAVITIDAP